MFKIGLGQGMQELQTTKREGEVKTTYRIVEKYKFPLFGPGHLTLPVELQQSNLKQTTLIFNF